MASPSPRLTASQVLDELADPVAPGGGWPARRAGGGRAARVSARSWDEASGIAAQADALRARVAPLAQLDADVFDQALAVRDGAAALPPEKRDWEIGKAFAAAAEPPLEIARVAADVAELAAAVAVSGEARVRPDAIAAATLAAAAARAAVTIVEANLTAVEGDARIDEAAQLAFLAERAAVQARRASV
jgi:formiminotetrahydrofolate cyclodeaminase